VTGDFAFLFGLYPLVALLAAINLNFSIQGKTTVEINTKFLIAIRLCSIVLLKSFVAASAIPVMALFKEEKIEDIALIVTFDGAAPAWPA
jgi:hypothetical protein